MMNYFTRKRYRTILFCIIFICLPVIIKSPPLLYAQSASPIITGAQNMSLGASSAFSILNYSSENSYTWELSNGLGTLSDTKGHTIIYTAPGSVEGREDLPCITVTDGEGQTQSRTIGLYPPGNDKTRYSVEAQECLLRRYDKCCPGILVSACCWELVEYNCDGSICKGPHLNDCCCHHPLNPNCDLSCARAEQRYKEYYPYFFTDDCWPEYPPVTIQKPTEETLLGDPEDCEDYKRKVGDPITIYNGNNYEKQEDLRFSSPNQLGLTFNRFYNSRSKKNAFIGYGWSHTYYLSLTIEESYLDPPIKILDQTGRGVYFQEGLGGRWDGAFKERSHVMAETDGYTWHRLDGTKYRFNEEGRLAWIEDVVGNRQTLSFDTYNRLQTVTDAASGRVLILHYNASGQLSHVSGPVTTAVPDGIWVRYYYDLNNNLISATYPDGSGFIYGYTDPYDIHNLTEKKDKLGHILGAWIYDDQDRGIESNIPNGQGATINYLSEQAVEVTDAYGIVYTYRIGIHEGVKRVIGIIGPDGCPNCGGKVIRYSYDNMLRVIEKEYANGSIHQYGDFDDKGNPQTIVQDFGTSEPRTISYSYHPNMDKKLMQIEQSLLGPGNKQTIWDYDNDGNDISNENPTPLLYRKIDRGYTKHSNGSVIPYEYITTYQYNSKGQLLSSDGPIPGNQDTTTYTYNPDSGDLLTVTHPIVGATSYGNYDGAGNVGYLIDINGAQTTYTYEGRNRIISIEKNGIVESRTYTLAGDLETTTDGAGRTTSYTYGATYGRLERITGPAGNSLCYAYDPQGNRIEESAYDIHNNRKRFLRFDYNHPQYPGRLWKSINPDNSDTVYDYDPMGNRTAVTDALNKTTAYTYNCNNQLTTVTQPGNIVTTYTYDSHDNLSAVTDAKNTITPYIYDDLGRLISTTSPDTGTTIYYYGAAGNLLSKTYAKGTTLSYIYDALNRLIEIHYPDPSQDITYTYDEGANGKGRLTGMSDPSGTYSYSYDAQGNLFSEEKKIAAMTYTIQYTYDPTGITTMITYPNGRTVTYEPDSAGRVIGVTITKGSAIQTLAENINYLPFGPMSELIYGNGTVTNKIFDQLYQVTGISTGAIQSLEYTIDPTGNITSITDNIDPTRSQAFGYDDLYRLTSATGIYNTVGYSYDKVGNRLTRTTNTTNSQTDTYTYIPNTNKLQEITGPNPLAFSYDANGNITAMGNKTLTYNQNNRIILSSENGIPLGEYIYNGQGQRVKKIVDGKTTIFLYDKDGNLITEADELGNTLREYVYMGSSRLCQFVYETPEEIEVSLTTSKDRVLSGINVYAFKESGSYTGLHAVTNEQGMAFFAVSDFTDGNYKFRADYLSCHLWSPVISIPDTYSTEVLIEEESTEVTVTAAGEEKEGVNVYLFNEGGSYLGVYQVTNTEGTVSFYLPVSHSFTFRADHMGSQYWSDATLIASGGINLVDIDTGGGLLSVTVQKDIDDPLIGIKVYLFTSSGSYLGHYDTTDDNGQVFYSISNGDYRIRADYLGYQFWSQKITVNSDEDLTLSIPHQDVTISVQEDYNGDVETRENLNIYLFNPSGSYLGKHHVTDDQGQVMFNLPEKDYKIRADYLSQQYFSDIFNCSDETITINEGMAELTVTSMGLPLEEVNVYAFSSTGSYLGIYDSTDFQGKVFFRLPEGDYNFRGDYMGSQYWSGITTIFAHGENPVNISTGGGSLNLTVQKETDNPLHCINCYLFSDSGSYLGVHGATNEQGEVSFNMADGAYTIRVDYMGYRFWTETFSVPDTFSLTLTIPHQDVTVTVEGDYNGDVEPRENLNAYLFSPSGSYLGKHTVTDDQGQVIFNLPEKGYKIRTDYLSQQYFSDIFNCSDETITINEGMAEVYMTQGSTPLENVNVYVFSSSNSYLGIYGKTNTNGIVSFRLPEGTYKFRGDYQGSRYWATESVNAHQINIINLNTEGGTFSLTVEKSAGSSLENIPVYVFSSIGSYLGLSGHTDNQGQVSFDLADGDYTFRADYMGYQFWTNLYTVPTTLSGTLTIPHQDVTVTVNEVYGAESNPLENINVYLFKPSGSYLGKYQVTNVQGQVTFSLPQNDYQVRVDYLSGQYFSDVFNWLDTDVTITHGLTNLHVTFNGEDVYDAPVYMFTDSGSYLGRYERTDNQGHAGFLIPEGPYKFRVDYEGTRYWSDVVNVIAHEETDVEMPLEQLALNKTNDPNPVRFDGEPPVYKPKEIRLASIGSLVGILSQTVVANTTSPKVYYYLNDHLDTPQIMTDENGVVMWQAQYKPFGEAEVNPNSSVDNNFRFPGQYYDQETGLHYNYHRYYDPRTGRYLRADPSHLMQPRGTNIPYFFLPYLFNTPQELNPYPYVINNPINFTDLTGLAIWVCNRKTSWGKGNHAYLWDNRNQTCCGMGSTKKCKESGPEKDSCRKVAGSNGKEGQIMKCCRDTADKGVWFPLINDCHEAINDCIEAAKLKNPGAAGGRLGKPCDPCEGKD